MVHLRNKSEKDIQFAEQNEDRNYASLIGIRINKGGASRPKYEKKRNSKAKERNNENQASAVGLETLWSGPSGALAGSVPSLSLGGRVGTTDSNDGPTT